MCVSIGEPVRVVLESDGTQVEDGEYFQTLPENTIFIVLRPGETWAPAGRGERLDNFDQLKPKKNWPIRGLETVKLNTSIRRRHCQPR